MYDVIVLGATFAAVGIAQSLGDRCLILERRPQVGYEFISSFNFGTAYDKSLTSDEAKDLQKVFEERNMLSDDRVCLFEISAPIYRLLEGQDVLLNTEIISIENKENHFFCTTFGVSGYRTFEAKKVIDTRTSDLISTSKTYNILLDSSEEIKADYDIKKWGREQNFVLRCPVDLADTYYQARQKAKEIIETLPDSKVVLFADTFDYQVKKGYPKTENDIIYLPSKKYENPLLAFDAGVCLGKELCNATF